MACSADQVLVQRVEFAQEGKSSTGYLEDVGVANMGVPGCGSRAPQPCTCESMMNPH